MPQHDTGTRRALLEREPHLRAVEEALADLTGRRADGTAHDDPGRRGGLLAFAGAAGHGKTSLLAEVRRRAAARGCTVLSARGGEQEQQVGFHVARQLLQPPLATATDAELRTTLGSWYGVVGPALGLCSASRRTPALAPAPGPEPDPEPDPRHLRDGLDWVLTHLAVQRAPAVLVLDDAHWADPQSLNWLAGFASRADDLPMLLVLGYRPGELPPGADAFRGLPGRAGHRPHTLEPLTEPAVARLVRDAAGAHADDAYCRECWELTSGVPCEAVALAAKARDRGITPDAAGVPALRALAAAVKGPALIARLERLGPATVRLAWAAAVLGAEARPSVAADVAGLGHQEAADCAERLRQARILTGGSALEFTHPLIATAVYRAVPDAVRTALHGHAANAAADAGLGPRATARHLLETHPEGDPWVVGRLRAAARDAQRDGDPQAARGYLTRALREPPQDTDRAAVLYELGCARELLEPAVTANHLRAALAEPDCDPELRDRVVLRLSRCLAHSGRPGEAAQAVAQAARRAPTARRRLRMQAEQFLWDALRADEPDAPGRSRRLTRLADRLAGRDLTERYVIGLRAWDATVRGEPAATALRHAGRALAGGLPWAAEDHGFEVPALVAMAYAYADRPERAADLLAAGVAEVERHGWHGAHLAFGLLLLAHVRHRQGRLAEAEELARDALRFAEQVGRGTPAQWYAAAVLIQALLARGETARAAALADAYDFRPPFPAATFPDAQTVYGELLLARGRHAEAAAELAAAGRRLDARGMRNPACCPWRQHLAAALLPGDPDAARRTARDALVRARQYGAASELGHALLVAGEVAAGPERLALLAESVTRLTPAPAAHLLARALVAHGTALRTEGRHTEAAERLRKGLATAERCAAAGTAARARAELALTAVPHAAHP